MEQKTSIIATIGPASKSKEVLQKMAHAGLGIARLNLAWGTLPERAEEVALIREVAREVGAPIVIMADTPRFRVQGEGSHTYDKNAAQSVALTEQDKAFLHFAVEQDLEYVAVSFVGSKEDVVAVRNFLQTLGGTQKIIAKIERKVALDHLSEIIAAADMLMVARGDLGEEVPLAEIPFVQQAILKEARAAGKSVIVATQMLLSMVEHPVPTRAEVSDVAYAVQDGAWGVMLSEESAQGAYPVEAVQSMSDIIAAASRYVKTL